MQLALLVLHERGRAIGEVERGRAPWAPFLHSWPSEAPALPESLDDATLEREAHDPAVVAGAQARRAWLHEQYAAAKEAMQKASAASGDGALEGVSFEEFCSAVRLVGSRCLRLSMGWEHGVRRLLVPVLDLANHDGQAPSAMYSSANLRS